MHEGGNFMSPIFFVLFIFNNNNNVFHHKMFDKTVFLTFIYTRVRKKKNTKKRDNFLMHVIDIFYKLALEIPLSCCRRDNSNMRKSHSLSIGRVLLVYIKE